MPNTFRSSDILYVRLCFGHFSGFSLFGTRLTACSTYQNLLFLFSIAATMSIIKSRSFVVLVFSVNIVYCVDRRAGIGRVFCSFLRCI